MTSIDYLDGVLHACVREQDATRTPAGQAASFDVLMDRAFERRHSDLCTHLTATRTRSKNAHTEVDRLSRTGLLDRFIAGTSLRGAKAELAQRQREEADAGSRRVGRTSESLTSNSTACHLNYARIVCRLERSSPGASSFSDGGKSASPDRLAESASARPDGE